MGNGRIFISYRRDDSAGYARAIYEQLVKRFSKDRVFMDVDSIEPGLPFDQVIKQAVDRCKILLAIIGKGWIEQKAGGGPRINDPNDFVRVEIVAALSGNTRVIPVLLDGATMPTEEALPEPLRPLARRNAIDVSNTRFSSDVERLVEVVSKVLGESDTSHTPQVTRSRRPLLYWLLGGVAMSSVWTFVRKPSNQRLLSWLGGGGAVAAAGIWAMVTYFWPAHESPKVECVQQGVKIGGNVSGSTVTNTASGRATSGPCVDSPKK
jgi:hypothetical protein